MDKILLIEISPGKWAAFDDNNNKMGWVDFMALATQFELTRL